MKKLDPRIKYNNKVKRSLCTLFSPKKKHLLINWWEFSPVKRDEHGFQKGRTLTINFDVLKTSRRKHK